VIKAEIPLLKIAFLHRQVLLSEEMGTPISYEAAEKDFLKKYSMPFFEGIKLYYCYYVCPDKEECEIKESEDMYQKILQHKKD